MSPLRRQLYWVLGVAAAVRVPSLILELQLPYLRHPTLDPAVYDAIGRGIAGGNVWLAPEVLHMSPLYSAVLGVVYALLGPRPEAVIVLQAAAGLATVALIHATARRLFGVGGWSLAAGLAAALYGPLVFYESQLLADSLGATLQALLLFLAVRALEAPRPVRAWAAVGAVLGAAVLLRASALLLGVPLAAACLRKPRSLIALGLCTAAMIAPVTLRNLLVAGEPVMVTDSGGLNFFIGNGRGANGTFRVPRSVPGATRPQLQFAAFRAVAEAQVGHPLDARGVDRFWYGQAARRIASDPAGWLALTGEKLWLFWNGRELPNSEDYDFHRLVNPVLALPLLRYVLVAPLALLGTLVWLARGRPAERLVAGVNLAGCVAIVLFFVLAHYRLLCVPGLILAATGGLRLAVATVRRRRAFALVALGAALAAFTALAVWPKLPKPFDDQYFKLGLAWHQDGRPDLAEPCYRNALAIRADHAGAQRNLALLLEASGRGDEAQAHWRALGEPPAPGAAPGEAPEPGAGSAPR